MTTSVQQFFPFIPDQMSWEDWNGNFIQWYSEEAVPYNTEDDWQVTARVISQMITFSAYPVPNPDTFDTWQDWAKEVTQIINGPSH